MTLSTASQPTNADADSAGRVLAFNRADKLWHCVSFTQIVPDIRSPWTAWDKLPPVVVKTEASVDTGSKPVNVFA